MPVKDCVISYLCIEQKEIYIHNQQVFKKEKKLLKVERNQSFFLGSEGRVSYCAASQERTSLRACIVLR